MKIANGTVVALDYRLHLGDDVTVDSSQPDDPVYFIQGLGEIVPGLEKALEGLEAGNSKVVVVTPEEGYGDFDPKRVQEVPHRVFGGELPEAGSQYTARGPEGQVIPFLVKEVRAETAIVDLNHPLAGRTLHFEVTVREVREATSDEKVHGHVHRPGDDH